MDVNVELLIGTKVYDANGDKVGRIEELRAEQDGKSCRVEAYLVGASALVDRLSAWTLVRPIARALRGRNILSVYEVPWQEMDLTDPKKPRLRVPKQELRHAR
ncbi:MAG TPA: PRC-barrel domain-containing protein [Gemmatimonadaceae bacterium]|nr:PRC-barrel domain-containing protein [Gemmatimonadaceae bacterium]